MTKFLAVLAFAGSILFAHATLSDSPPPVIELTPSNTLVIRGAITDQSVSHAQREFYKLVDKRDKAAYALYIVFDSPGGSVNAGMAFYETVVAYPNVHTIIVRGYSMAAVLPQLLPGHRYLMQSSVILFHPMKTAAPEPATTEQAKKDIEFSAQMELDLESKIAKRAKQTLEFYKKNAAFDWMLYAPKALELGFADSIVVLKCSLELRKQSKVVMQQVIPFLPPIPVTESACPLQL